MSTVKYLGAFALGSLFALAAHAGGSGPDKKASDGKPASDADAGMRAYVDPETGTLTDRPVTAKQARDAAAAMPTGDASKVRMIQHANGMREYQLNGQADEALVAVVGADGKIEYRCAAHGVVHDHATALQPETANDR